MSGPIIRKYGFPNFDKIFGEKPIQHGSDPEPDPTSAPASKPTDSQATRANAERSNESKAADVPGDRKP